jgi:hypothetical protein
VLNVRGAAYCLPAGGTPISRRRAIGLIGSLAAVTTVNQHPLARLGRQWWLEPVSNDRALWHRSLDQGRWSAWESLGGQNIASDPAVASWGQGRLDVFVITSGGQLWTRSHQA